MVPTIRGRPGYPAIIVRAIAPERIGEASPGVRAAFRDITEGEAEVQVARPAESQSDADRVNLLR